MSKGLIGFLWHETLKPLRQISKSVFNLSWDGYMQERIMQRNMYEHLKIYLVKFEA